MIANVSTKTWSYSRGYGISNVGTVTIKGGLIRCNAYLNNSESHGISISGGTVNLERRKNSSI